MPRRYETPNYGLSNEPQTPQENVIRQLETAERGRDPLPPSSISEQSGEWIVIEWHNNVDHLLLQDICID